MAEKACTSCQQTFPESELYYGDNGMLCASCMSDAEVRSGFQSGYSATASGAMGCALLSWFFNPCFLTTIATIVAAVYTFRYPGALDPEDRAQLKGKNWVPAVAVLAILIALARVGLAVMAEIATQSSASPW